MRRALSHFISEVFLFILSCLVLTGCHSSRKVSQSVSYSPVQVSPAKEPIRTYSSENASTLGKKLAAEVYRWVGTPYKYGGHDHEGVDCSGLMMEVYGSVCHKKLPRTTTEQQAYCVPLAREQATPGDLVFFSTGSHGGKPSHVGMYVGEGKMVHASTSRGVTESAIDEGYWGARYLALGRVPGMVNDSGETLSLSVQPSSVRDAEPGKTSSPSRQTQNSSSPLHAMKNAVEVDLLDLIIEQKTDSIFQAQFME